MFRSILKSPCPSVFALITLSLIRPALFPMGVIVPFRDLCKSRPMLLLIAFFPLCLDVWPGTWLWRPVAAPVVGLLWPGPPRVRRRHRGSRHSQRRRRFLASSLGVGGGCCGSLFLAASGDGGGAGGGVRGRLN